MLMSGDLGREGENFNRQSVGQQDGEKLGAGLLRITEQRRQSGFLFEVGKMGELRQQMEERLKLEGYSYRTRNRYLQHMRRFVAYHRKNPRQLAASDIQRYLLYLLDEKGASRSYVNQAIKAIKYL